MRALRRLLACALVLTLIGEASGVARAFGRSASVHCCCGAHFAARPCPCPDCPSSQHRSRWRAAGPAEAQLDLARDCDGASADEPAVLHVLATLPTPPLLSARPASVFTLFSPLFTPRGRIVELDRPPP